MNNSAKINFDQLKSSFRTIASALSDSVTKYKDSNPLLINLNGQAGSGKTSVINGFLDIIDSYYLLGKTSQFTLDSIKSSKSYIYTVRIMEGLGIFFILLNCLILSICVIDFNFWDYISNTTLYYWFSSIPGIIFIKSYFSHVTFPVYVDDIFVFVKLVISAYITFLIVFFLVNYLIFYKLFSFLIDNIFVKPVLYISEVFRKEESKKKRTTPVVITFDVWNYPDFNSFLVDFFYLLSLKLASDKSNIEFKTASNLLNRYYAQIKGELSSHIKRKTMRIVPFLADDSLMLKQKISNILLKSEKKFIIVFENFEKLDSKKILLTLQLIKSVINFPNFIFIVPTDYSKFGMMKISDNDDLYIDELVKNASNIYYEMPSIDKEDLKNLLLNRLDSLLIYYSIPEERFNVKYFEIIYDLALKNLFVTYKDVDRFIDSVIRVINIIKQDVYISEYLAISALCMYRYDVYTFIKQNKELLLNLMYDGKDPDYKLFDTYQGTLKEFFDGQNNIYTFEIKLLLMSLFPELESYYEAEAKFLPEYFKELRNEELYKKLTISNPDNFNMYFKLSLGVPPTYNCFELNEVIKAYLEDKDSIYEFLETLDQKKINDLLFLLVDYENHYATRNLNYDNVMSIVASILDYIELKRREEVNQESLMPAIPKILTSSKCSTRYNSIKSIIEKCERNLYFLTTLVDKLDKIIITPTAMQKEALNDLLYRKFEDSEKSLLVQNRKLLSVLSYFYRSGFQSDINIFVFELISECDNVQLATILSSYVPEELKIQIFDDRDLLNEKLLQLKASEYFLNLPEEQKNTILLFESNLQKEE